MADKATKAEEHYRFAGSRAESRCGNCTYMNPDGTCQQVQGFVLPDHVCDLFERR